MRGVVTLAAAFAIPLEAPHREVLLLIALVVTAGTLLLHGLTLPWVVRVLRVPSPDPREDALARAELLQQATQAGLARLEELEPEDDEDRRSTTSSAPGSSSATSRPGSGSGPAQPDGETPSERYARLRLDMLQAERARVLEWRGRLKTPAHVVEDVLATLDIEESMIGPARGASSGSSIDGDQGRIVGRVADFCDDLSGCRDPGAAGGPALRGLRPRGHARGCTCGCAWSAATSAAATPRPAGTPPRTSATPTTPSSAPPSPARSGAGASSTRSSADARRPACGRHALEPRSSWHRATRCA